MKYTTEELSACKTKVNVSVPVEEIDAAISAAVALQRRGVALAGFRKGHVPANIIEQRFKGQLYHEACQDLVNVHINQIMGELSLQVLGGVKFDKEPSINRGEPLEYTLNLEHLPAIELPDYEGVEIEQEEKQVTQSEIDAFLLRLREDHGKMVPIDGDGPAKEGEYVNVDLVVSVEGAVKPELGTQGYDLLVGQKHVLPELDELATSLKAGESGTRDVTFAADFLNQEIAGKSGSLTMTVHAIKERQIPELDSQFCSQMGVASLEELHKNVEFILKRQLEAIYRSAAEKKLLDRLLKNVDFALPEILVKTQMGDALSKRFFQAERMGKTIKDPEALRKELEPLVNEQVKATVFLLAVARKEGLEVSDQEVNNQIYQIAHDSGADHKAVHDYYVKSGLIFSLRDSLLADKGMHAIYQKAKVTMVPAAQPEPAPEAPAAEAPAEAPVAE